MFMPLHAVYLNSQEQELTVKSPWGFGLDICALLQDSCSYVMLGTD